MSSVSFGSNTNVYHNFNVGGDHISSGSFQRDIDTQIIPNTGNVYNFLTMLSNLKGCMDFGPYTFVPFNCKIDGYSEERGNFKTKITELYPNGTPVIRQSGEYHTSTKVTSIITTDDSMTIDTDKGRFLFTGVTNFIRYKNNDTEPTVHTTLLGTGMTTWSQTERDDLFARIF